MKRFSRKPLFYDSLWRTLILFLMVLCFEFVEGVLGSLRSHGFQGAIHQSSIEMSGPTFYVLAIWVFLLVGAYVFVRALIREIGFEAFVDRFFGRRRATLTREGERGHRQNVRLLRGEPAPHKETGPVRKPRAP
jgi:hypothetical protein